MKKLFLFLLFATVSLASVNSQVLDPVKWSTSIKKISETEFDLISKATIEDKWHLYSQVVPDNGPLPTNLTFEENSAYKLVGKAKESKGHTVHDPVFDMIITFFENTATFTQRVKLTGDKGTTIKGEVEFMVCDDTRCLPPSYVDLVFKIPDPEKVTETVTNTENPDNIENTTAASEATVDTTIVDTSAAAIETDTLKTELPTPELSAAEQNKKTGRERALDNIYSGFPFWVYRITNPVRVPDDSDDGELFYQTKQIQDGRYKKCDHLWYCDYRYLRFSGRYRNRNFWRRCAQCAVN